jgi:Zn-dependent oligopeptidase
MKKNNTNFIIDDLSWTNTNKEELLTFVEKAEIKIKDYVAYFSILKNLENQELNFKNVIQKKDELTEEIFKMISIAHNFELLHPDAEMRKVSQEVSLKISEKLNALTYNEDIYSAFKKYFENNFKKEKKNLSSEEILIVEDTAKSYKKIGMDLPKKSKQKLIEIQNKIDKLSQEFYVDYTKSYERGIWFTGSDLEGIPESFLNLLKKENDKYFVSSKPTEIHVVRKNAFKKETRQALAKLLDQGAGDANTKRMMQTLKLRNEATKILGYKTFIEIATDEQIIKGEKNILNFLNGLVKGLNKNYKEDKRKMSEILKKINDKLDISSVWFAENQMKKSEAKIDEEKLKEYFEVDNTVNAMWQIWEKYFGLKVNFVKTLEVFDKDVKVYDVIDKKEKKIRARIILDLFPREGKYGHVCVSSFSKRWKNLNEDINIPTIFLICNFIKNKNGKTLLSFVDTVILFHEGGHLLHAVLSKNNYKATCWNNVSTDFVEIPSQTLEKFANTKIGLMQIGKHFQTGKKLPQDLLNKIENMSKDTLYKWYRQFNFALFDIGIHGKNILNFTKKVDSIGKYFEKLSEKVLGLKHLITPQRGSDFAHLIDGYESKYYSYVVSKVYADDVWEKFSSNNFKLKNNILKYKEMLENGATKKENEMLKTFLGRNPNDKSFIKNLIK